MARLKHSLHLGLNVLKTPKHKISLLPAHQSYVLFMSNIPGNQQKCVNSMSVGD
jgi:hypothetical protein